MVSFIKECLKKPPNLQETVRRAQLDWQHHSTKVYQPLLWFHTNQSTAVTRPFYFQKGGSKVGRDQETQLCRCCRSPRFFLDTHIAAGRGRPAKSSVFISQGGSSRKFALLPPLKSLLTWITAGALLAATSLSRGGETLPKITHSPANADTGWEDPTLDRDSSFWVFDIKQRKIRAMELLKYTLLVQLWNKYISKIHILFYLSILF